VFEAWLAPFRDLGVTTITIRNTGGTDHQSFDQVGLPGFQFIQDEVEYERMTHHSNMDVYDHAVSPDLMQAAAVIATVVYHAANRPELLPRKELPPQLQRQLVDYVTSEPAGTIIIDTPHTFLYLVRGGGKAVRYGIGVGREGFTWTGTERVSRMTEWPDWHPPKEMIERQPYLPRFMAGGEGNPLGARALYLGNTLYRIHGTNQPSTIGHFVSSGCIRLTNEDIEDLYSRVNLGTRVVVLPGADAASPQRAVAR